MTTNLQPEPLRPDHQSRPGPATPPTSSLPPFAPGDPVVPGEGGTGGMATAMRAPEKERLDKGLVTSIAVGYAGIWVAFFTPVIVTLQLQVHALDPAHETRTLSIVLSVSAVFSILTNPVAGLLSDRTTGRFGRRRPWLLVWMLVGVLGLSIQAFSPNVAVLITGSVLGQIGFAGMLSVILATLPDFIPASRRGTTSAILGVTQSIGIVIGASAGGALAGNVPAAYLVPAGIGLALVLVLVLRLPDRQVDAGLGAVSFRKIASSYWVNPRRHPDFGWAWLSRFTMYLGFASANNYLVFYLSHQLGETTKQAAANTSIITSLTALCVIVSSIVGGGLSDRLGRRRLLVATSAVIGFIGLIVYAFATTLPVVFLAAAIFGIAEGAYAAVDLALVTEVLPDKERSASTHLGVITIANQLPQSLAPAFAPALLGIGVGSVVGAAAGQNYTMLFLGSAVFGAISAITIFKVRSVR